MPMPPQPAAAPPPIPWQPAAALPPIRWQPAVTTPLIPWPLEVRTLLPAPQPLAPTTLPRLGSLPRCQPWAQRLKRQLRQPVFAPRRLAVGALAGVQPGAQNAPAAVPP